jgi:hypothetical protein
MEFIENYFYIIILIVGAIAQWMKSRSGSNEEKGFQGDEAGYDPAELEEFIGEAERRNSRPSVPPPLPSQAGGALPGAGRSPVPDLRRKSPTLLQEAAVSFNISDELDRQQELIEKAREFKRAKIARKSKEVKISGASRVSKVRTSGIRGRLHSRSEIRSAFVLKEILDKPVGLR